MLKMTQYLGICIEEITNKTLQVEQNVRVADILSLSAALGLYKGVIDRCE